VPSYRLTIEYEGTRYRGWQEQRNAHTVAGELRGALEAVVGARLELGGSGRTDAGVHALAQVAHLRSPRALDGRALQRAVNERLPADINILAIAPADTRFHARHTAVARSYLYQISRRRTAFGKRFVWWVKARLDEAAMAEAARMVVGRHDFAEFCERPEEQTSTVVVVEAAEVVTAGELILVRLVASHFLWKMVRRVVGTLVRVGGGELEPRDVAALIRGGEQALARGNPAEWTAPPSGLFLERVLYPGDSPLAAVAPAMPVSSRRGE
jgi:tRNA pseudouridine38-40 synthase